MLDKLRKVRVHTASSHLSSGPGSMGLFIHTTLQELRVLEEFNEALLENHNLIWYNMVPHLFSIYVTKSELYLMTASFHSTQIKYNELESTITVQEHMIEANTTALGNLKLEMARKK